MRTADLLVSKPEPWLGLEEAEVGEQVGKWQEQVDRAARTMGEHLDPEMATKLSSKGAGGIMCLSPQDFGNSVLNRNLDLDLLILHALLQV